MPYLAVLIYFIFFAGIAMTVNEGLWSNAISLFCVTFAGLLAWYWGPVLGGFVVDQAKPSEANEWAFWFASIWGIFFFAVMLLRVGTDRMSPVRMKFIKPVDMAGGLLLGLGVAVMFTSFAAYSLYIPFKASVWKVQEAAGWQQQTFTSAAAPMYGAIKAFYGEDVPDINRP